MAFFSLLLCQTSCLSPGLQHIWKKTEQMHTLGAAMDNLASYLPILYRNSGTFHYLLHFSDSTNVHFPCPLDFIAHSWSYMNDFHITRGLHMLFIWYWTANTCCLFYPSTSGLLLVCHKSKYHLCKTLLLYVAHHILSIAPQAPQKPFKEIVSVKRCVKFA